MALPLTAGCSHPPTTVRATDLARNYRDRPAVASQAYDGRRVLVALTNPVVRGHELHWHLAGPDVPAVVVCRFEGAVPTPAPVVWIVGTCRGRVDDGAAREFTGYTFHVVIEGCRVADPPTTPAP